ncbi:MAG: SH3 domain-containing protein [Pseudomonadota bacterium]|nr:SH3 domain-containing protein [Pseudomonadota bacterium]
MNHKHMLFLLALTATAAVADPGDLYKVSGERVNLRAGPGNEAAVLGTVEAGDELIELQQEGDWLGVRVLGSGDEGWIYNDLVQRVAQSRLTRPATPMSLGDISPGFGQVVERVNEYLGYPMIDRVETLDDGTLRITPTRDWLLRTGTDAHVMAVMAFYQLWKSHQDDRPVSLVLLDGQNDSYLTLKDEDTGPVLSVFKPRR